ncbi:molybdenum cofactor guanylyltransferase [Leptolyngbya sp. NIES-2104]|uniref:molybdenum cofactor guanylyltransferase n=1 Tax=Leptolyngbya sp. NIES-2104 TaxID=1552121 RepID=UPI0006ECA9ED|nr:molybdenum cofactor guanylyltransferase [Leptolyngbya sp. NIES-2104]GAP95008.1 molybdopterin-guanine dinucleotide biosynthesis protein MobA [Leptolyngbya sp. NIES-2104]
MDNLSAIILAGGKSSRMGQDKALIEIDGVPLLKRTYDAAKHCTDSIYVVTSWRDRYESILSDVNWIDESAPRSPIIAFTEAFQQVSTEWVLLLACDMPRLNGETLQELTAQLGESSIVVARSEEGWEPLCGFYRRDCLPSLQNYLASGKRSFQDWLNSENVQELELSDRQILFNCNTPTDLEQVD